jgi:hypothetical protein
VGHERIIPASTSVHILRHSVARSSQISTISSLVVQVVIEQVKMEFKFNIFQLCSDVVRINTLHQSHSSLPSLSHLRRLECDSQCKMS